MATVATSLVPATIDALVAIVDELDELVDIPVLYDAPNPPSQFVGFGAVDPWEQSLRPPTPAPGTVFREETFTVHGAIVVRVPGDSAIEARDRAFEIFAAIERRLRADLTLGVMGVTTALMSPRSSHPYVFDEGREHEIEFVVDVSGLLNVDSS
jgi:hypothetical protein